MSAHREVAPPTGPSMRILIAGSTHWPADDPIIGETLRSCATAGDVLVVGTDPGAAQLAMSTARDIGMWIEAHSVEGHRRADVRARNAEMVSEGADLCLAFPTRSTGGSTWDCVRRARRAGIPITINKPEGYDDAWP